MAAERPPLGAFATSLACAGAILGFAATMAAPTIGSRSPRAGAGRSGNKAGVAVMQADVDLHQGAARLRRRPLRPTGRDRLVPLAVLRDEGRGYARLGRKDADDAIATAEASIGEHRYARGILLRAKGIRSGDDAALRESLALFEELDCPYQAARSGWLLGGKDARGGEADVLEPRGDPARLTADVG